MDACPSCGAARDGAVRFCPACGLDYWRAAAGQTVHGSPPPEPAPASAPAPRTNLPALMVIAGVFILVGAAIGAALMSGLIPLRGVAGRPPPTPHILTPEEAIIYAFFREVRDPRAEYRVTTEAETTYSGLEQEIPPVTVTSDIRIYADDWQGSETVVADEEEALEYEMVLVDGVGYVSEEGGEWLSEEIPDRLQPVSPFRRISTVTEITYVGSETVDGRPQHTLLITKWLGGRDYSDPLRRFARIVSQESRMEVTVDNFGIPSVAKLDLTVIATDGVDTLTITGHATYRISDWDEGEPIVAPSSVADPAT